MIEQEEIMKVKKKSRMYSTFNTFHRCLPSMKKSFKKFIFPTFKLLRTVKC